MSAVIDAIAGKPDPRLTEVAVSAYVWRVHFLKQLGREQEAREVETQLEKLGTRLLDADDQQLAAQALFKLSAEASGAQDRIELLDAVVATLAKHPGSGRDAAVSARALVNKGLELADL